MTRSTQLLIAFAINVVLVAGFRVMTHTPPGGPNVVDLQLSMSPGVFKQIVDLWGPPTAADVRRSIWMLDFLKTHLPCANFCDMRRDSQTMASFPNTTLPLPTMNRHGQRTR